MLIILAEHITPRVEYICHILFGTILRSDFKILQNSGSTLPEGYKDDAILVYNENKPSVSGIHIPLCGLLSETGIKPQNAEFDSDLTKLYFNNKQYEGFDFDFDVLSAAFYLITSYELYANPVFDEHGRYDENNYFTFKNNAHKLPLLNIWAEELWTKIVEKYPLQVRKKHKFTYKISFDIDSPYLFRGKGIELQTAGLLKNALLMRWKQAALYLKIATGQKDPYDVYDYILSLCTKEELLFFFLFDRHSLHDTRYTYNNKQYRRLIAKIAGLGIKTGIHPSYNSYLDEKMIGFEKGKLEEITKAKTDMARMHFLKYRLPETYLYLVENGILHDYTACPVKRPGFKNFIARSFLWFNLAENRTTKLTIHPTMVMDRTLESYMKMDANKAFDVLKEYIDLTAQYGGEFIPLFHNSTLSELDEWRGWRQVFEKTVRYLHIKTNE